MDEIFFEKITALAKQIITDDDPSHDWQHICRVLNTAKYIASREDGDLEIIIPAALLHDAVNHPKDDSRALSASDESAELARKILEGFDEYPKEKIKIVEEAIRCHSFSKGLTPESIEAKIIQDADRLEATGAISIMRTFSSSGQMRRGFYNPEDPFCERGEHKNLDNAVGFALDLFYKRLLKVGDAMNTKTAKDLAKSRTEFLYKFLEQLKEELKISLPK